jgi:tRNA(fMet)-specific endonuclease VapC
MSRRYLLDTNVVSHVMQGRDQELLARLTQLRVGQAVMSSVTLGEIEYGLHRKGEPPRLRNALHQLRLHVEVLPWDDAAATCYGALCSTLESKGINLSDFDMMIAAHAVAADAVLVSRDKAFTHIPSGIGAHWHLEIW